jgi:glycosyltransferase involved in cell wall biosynthesis
MGRDRKRILHLVDSEGVYGAERVILNLSREMNRAARYEPVVGCIVRRAEDPNDLFAAAVAQGIEAVKIPLDNARLARDLPRAALQVRKLGIDLVHSHGYKPSVFGFVWRQMTGVRILATCHLWFEPAKGPLKMRVMVRLEKRLYRSFPVVVAVSDPIRQVLVGSGVAPDRVRVIKNGVDLVEARPTDASRAALRRELGLEPGDYCVLNAGRLARQKAQDVIIAAAAALRRAGAPCRFLIVGEGGLREELLGLIRAADATDAVSLLGFRADMPDLLDLTDVFVLPSLDEGMPIALLEAALAGVPVIATPVGDVPKLVAHEVTGLLVPVGDAAALAAAIARLRGEPELGRRLAAAARAAILRDYSSAAMNEQYADVYAAVLAG